MSRRDRRAVALGGGVLLLALVGVRGVPAVWHGLHAWHERSQQAANTLAARHALIAVSPHLRDSLRILLPQIVALAPELIDGRSPSDATASLAALLETSATRHALKVIRVDPLPSTTSGVFSRVAVHGSLEGDIRGLVGVLRSLETGSPLLTVETLSVDAVDRDRAATAPEVLRIELTVVGWGMPREGS